MLKFFRQIRQNLLTENKFGKYLLYALGEIFLVVIGILIALQVNVWNEKRKLETQELKILNEIKENLIVTQKNINDVIQYHQVSIISYKLLLEHLEKQLPYQDSLSLHFSKIGTFSSPFPTTIAYESLKQKGIDIIKNDSLKHNITEMYERDLRLLKDDLDKTEWMYSESVVLPYASKHFRPSKIERKVVTIPNDYEFLVQDSQIKNILSILLTTREFGILQLQDISQKIEKLVSQIDKELKKRDFQTGK